MYSIFTSITLGLPGLLGDVAGSTAMLGSLGSLALPVPAVFSADILEQIIVFVYVLICNYFITYLKLYSFPFTKSDAL